MARRFRIPKLWVGEVHLEPAEAHHALAVLRLETGEWVELFDDAGFTAGGELIVVGDHGAAVRVRQILPPAARFRWTVAAALPKGDRADWMVEKLSELGAAAFIPLAATRSVVLPEGTSKHQRWQRLAVESAKQSRRAGVMRIDSLTSLGEALDRLPRKPHHPADAPSDAGAAPAAWVMATEIPAMSVNDAIADALVARLTHLTIFIGPEGGWTAGELQAFTQAGVVAVRLTHSVLRVETAAVAAGAIVASMLAGG